ncbi:MAG: hypothetical protein IT423_11730 [Pirellulaceae bacterium]|nr:hypothetical protein [Pirellulaceae bacterium]
MSSRWNIVAGLLTATLGIGIVWASGFEFRTVIPPGILVLPMVAGVVAVMRWHWPPLVAAVIALYIATGILTNDGLGVLAGHSGYGVAVGRWIQLIGLLIATILGTVYVWRQVGASWQKRRLLSIAGVLLGSPICAEFLQAYMSFDAVSLPFILIFFAPLYGGAALLIREAAVRTGRGWVGILLLAGAFGILMPGVIDLAMWGEQRSDIAYWSDLRLPTLIPALGWSVYPMVLWVLGHIVMSIGTPLALLDGLVPELRGQPLLRWRSILLLAMLFFVVAWLVHLDGRERYGFIPTNSQLASVTAVAAGLVVIAFSPFGRPITLRFRRWTPGWMETFIVGLLGLVADAFASPNWAGTAWMCAVISTVSACVMWFARSPTWGLHQTTGLACGALTAQTLMGFLAPSPEGMDPFFKYTLHSVFLVAVLGICARARKTSQTPRQSAHDYIDATSV